MLGRLSIQHTNSFKSHLCIHLNSKQQSWLMLRGIGMYPNHYTHMLCSSSFGGSWRTCVIIIGLIYCARMGLMSPFTLNFFRMN